MAETPNIIDDLLFKEECYKIIGLSMKVHTKLGKGFKEVVYKDALEIEFKKNTILYEREKPFNIQYDDVILKHHFDADFFVFDSVILEIKAARMFHYDNFRQTLNYLKASQVKLGILINFGEDKLNFKRVVCTY
jgi:GxxExxY protein